jgi:hypothetical protein
MNEVDCWKHWLCMVKSFSQMLGWSIGWVAYCTHFHYHLCEYMTLTVTALQPCCLTDLYDLRSFVELP